MVTGVLALRTAFRNVSCRFCGFSVMGEPHFYCVNAERTRYSPRLDRTLSGRVAICQVKWAFTIKCPRLRRSLRVAVKCLHAACDRPRLAVADRTAVDPYHRHHAGGRGGDERLLGPGGFGYDD